MTLPKALPIDHPRVDEFREELEDVVVDGFESGVHAGILMANLHRAAAMLLAGMGGTREQFMDLSAAAWASALEECSLITALKHANDGLGAKA